MLDLLRTSLDAGHQNHQFRFARLQIQVVLLRTDHYLFLILHSDRGLHGDKLLEIILSLIGQIGSPYTTAVMTMLDALVFEPVQEWDALIYSPAQGAMLLAGVVEDRREQLRRRCGARYFPQPQLPVIRYLRRIFFQIADGK